MNSSFRKVLNILLAVFLCLGIFTGCTKPADDTKPDPTPAPTPETTPSEDEVVYTIDNIRDYVIGVNEEVELEDGTKTVMINFDNAATTPALKPVMDTVDTEMKMYGSIGRGFSQKSNHSTEI